MFLGLSLLRVDRRPKSCRDWLLRAEHLIKGLTVARGALLLILVVELARFEAAGLFWEELRKSITTAACCE